MAKSYVYDVKPHLPGIRQVLRDPAVRSMCTQASLIVSGRANSMLNPKLRRAGAQYVPQVVMRKYGYVGRVVVGGKKNGLLAWRDNNKHNTLRKAARR